MPAAGDHVFADFGQGKVLAHVLDDGHQNEAGETKYVIQNPANGAGEELTLRNPADRDTEGSGRTFWPLDAPDAPLPGQDELDVPAEPVSDSGADKPA